MVETDINKRWEQGTDHHPASLEAIEALAELDYYLGDDSFCIKVGGDGDNGERMMYLLDIFFEAKDQGMTLQELISKVKPEWEVKMRARYPDSFKNS